MKLTVVSLPSSWCESVLLRQQPFVGDGYERVDFGIVLGATLCARVNSVRYAPPSGITFLSRSFQRDVGVRAEGQQLFYPAEAVSKPP